MKNDFETQDLVAIGKLPYGVLYSSATPENGYYVAHNMNIRRATVDDIRMAQLYDESEREIILSHFE